jgi:hypothetical protein
MGGVRHDHRADPAFGEQAGGIADRAVRLHGDDGPALVEKDMLDSHFAFLP